MNSQRRKLLIACLGLGAGLCASGSVWALNPQPEVPSRARQNRQQHQRDLKALNPQPEVPSKSKKSQRRRKKSLPKKP